MVQRVPGVTRPPRLRSNVNGMHPSVTAVAITDGVHPDIQQLG